MATRLTIVSRDVQEAVADIREELLDCRHSLPAAGNHQSPSPRDPFAKYAHGELVSNRGPAVTGLQHLMGMSFANVDQGMPAPQAKRWLHRAERFVDIRAAERHPSDLLFVPPPLPIAFRREQRANGHFDLDQLRTMESRRDRAVLAAAIKSCRTQIDTSQEALASLEAEYARLTMTDTVRLHA